MRFYHAYNIPNGSRVYVASKCGDEINITDTTNAEEAVLTVDSIGDINAGDVVQIVSGWKKYQALFV
ncbi:MAG TPA: hypothetical protein ACHBX0_12515 [Arsenophonus sp.]